MNCKQNQKINQVKESNLTVGIDIGSTAQYARTFDWQASNWGRSFNSATVEKALKASKTGCSGYRTRMTTKAWRNAKLRAVLFNAVIKHIPLVLSRNTGENKFFKIPNRNAAGGNFRTLKVRELPPVFAFVTLNLPAA